MPEVDAAVAAIHAIAASDLSDKECIAQFREIQNALSAAIGEIAASRRRPVRRLSMSPVDW